MQHPEEAEDEAWIYTGQPEVPPAVRRVKIAENVTEIPEEAFKRHQHLEEVILSSSVQVIGKEAFYECEKLKSILYQGREKEKVEIPSIVKVIDERLERIGNWAFLGCKSLSHVRIPRSVNSLATNAFSICSDLISIELPEECSFDIDLSGCQSLVNLAGPVSILFPDEEDRGREEFFQSSKFGSLVDDEADLTHRLNHRFDNSPLNKLCYYQAYQSSDDAMAELRSLMEEYSPLAATTEVDEFGMTPLHVLSLAQTPNLDMLLAVMDAGKSGHMARTMDSFGCTPMDYLFLNRMPNSNEVIRRLFQTRFDQVSGGLHQFWKSDMFPAIDEVLAGDWASRKSKIGEVVRKFERKEILSLLELCLWKVKIGEATSKKEQILADRQRCRIMSGAAVVIPHLLPFLDN
eukprot:scaffold10211_cov110-Cylindrotheca_fusiformis.AAC.1